MRHSQKYDKKSLSPLALLAAIAAAVVAASILAPIVSAKRPRQPEPESWAAQSERPRRAGDEQRPGNNQQDDKAIKLSSDLVTVLTSVSDASGNHVDDLGKNDFTVLEDNRPQDIAALYREDQMPLRLIFLFDTSLSIKHRFDFEQRAAARFFQQVMRPGDQAAIMSVSTDSRLETQFTSNVNKLVDTLSRLQPGGATSLYNAMIDSAKYLRPAEGRHVMVVLSDGADTISSATLAQALTEVQKSDAMIFAVHSTGIAPSANVQDLGGEYVLKFMCEDTGGRAFFPPIYEDQAKEARDLDEIYRRLAAEVRAQYVLTYYSNSPSRDGHFRANAPAFRCGPAAAITLRSRNSCRGWP
jgi:Ca-activated chloride channel family protein